MKLKRKISVAPTFVDDLNYELAFCPTGPGGGQDNSCGRGGGGKDAESKKSDVVLEAKRVKAAADLKKAMAFLSGAMKAHREGTATQRDIDDAQREVKRVNKELLKIKSEQKRRAAKIS